MAQAGPAGAPVKRMTLGNVRRGRIEHPQRVILYGVAGIGKSTFASHAPMPIFLPVEDGTAELDVARFPKPTCFTDVLDAIDTLSKEEHSFQTFVIDTLDALEALVWAHVCKSGNKDAIEDFGYGKGYVAALDAWRLLLARLERLQATRKMHLVCIGHAAAKNRSDPTRESFARWQLNLHDKAADLVTGWAHTVLFACHEVFAKKDGLKWKGFESGKRIVRTRWKAGYDAKSRVEIPDPLPLGWDDFIGAATGLEQLQGEVAELLAQLPDDKRAKAQEAATKAGADLSKLASLLNKLRITVDSLTAATPTTNSNTNPEETAQ